MKTKFNFNSQICTTREQSERLLALGLKKETADCYYWQETEPMYGEAVGIWNLETLDSKDNQEHFEYLDKNFGVCLADDEEHYFIPSWSLGRLLEMLPSPIPISEDLPTFHHYAYLDLSKVSAHYYWEDYDGAERALASFCGNGFFAAVGDATEWLIKEGNFPKEYLEE